MVKKIAAVAAAGAILLSVAGPAFGSMISLDEAYVWNNSSAMAITGNNTQNNSASVSWTWLSGAGVDSVGTRYISTGDAGAYSGALVVANTDVCSDSGWLFDTNIAVVGNNADVAAVTGQNSQDDSASVYQAPLSGAGVGGNGARTIYTGDAGAASRAWTVVNTSFFSF